MGSSRNALSKTTETCEATKRSRHCGDSPISLPFQGRHETQHPESITDNINGGTRNDRSRSAAHTANKCRRWKAPKILSADARNVARGTGGGLEMSYQQVHKYERNENRISAGRLFQFAQILCVPIEDFFGDPETTTAATRSVSDFARSVTRIRSQKSLTALCDLVRGLVERSKPSE